jgi:hypothetical protein
MDIYTMIRAISGHGYEFQCDRTGRLVTYPMTQIVGDAKRHKGKKFKLIQSTMFVISNQ